MLKQKNMAFQYKYSTVNNKEINKKEQNMSDDSDDLKVQHNYMNDTVTKPWAGTTIGSELFTDNYKNSKVNCTMNKKKKKLSPQNNRNFNLRLYDE